MTIYPKTGSLVAIHVIHRRECTCAGEYFAIVNKHQSDWFITIKRQTVLVDCNETNGIVHKVCIMVLSDQ